MAAILKLSRDETRIISGYFFFWHSICEHYIMYSDHVENQEMIWKISDSVLQQVEQKINNRLNGFAQKFRFTFSNAEAITVMEFLKKQPIPSDQIWLINLRQHIIDVLHLQTSGTI